MGRLPEANIQPVFIKLTEILCQYAPDFGKVL